jgi:polyisoprenoid-binding protein YceI
MPFATRIIAGIFLCLPASLANAGEPEQYRLDPVHTRVMFAIDHAGFSKAIGTVSGSTGTLVFDPQDWRSAQLRASVPMARIDLGDAAWNKATLAGNLLDAEDHPTAEFVSTRVEPLAPDRATVHGTLTLRGVSREVALVVTLNAAKRHPLPPFRRTVGFSATATLSRKAFGIDAWPTVIGDTVELRIEAEAIRGRTDDDTDATDPPVAASSSADAAPDTPPDTTTEPAP